MFGRMSRRRFTARASSSAAGMEPWVQSLPTTDGMGKTRGWPLQVLGKKVSTFRISRHQAAITSRRDHFSVLWLSGVARAGLTAAGGGTVRAGGTMAARPVAGRPVAGRPVAGGTVPGGAVPGGAVAGGAVAGGAVADEAVADDPSGPV